MLITSVHGVDVRPRKKAIHKGHVTLRFVITGSIPSKKNNQVPIIMWNKADQYAAKCFQAKGHLTKTDYDNIKGMTSARIVPNKRYQKWEIKTLPLMIEQRNKWTALIASKGLIWPLAKCSMSVYTYKADKKKRDFDNRLSSVQDLFKKSMIILDDDDTILKPILLDGDNYVGEVKKHTCVINLTAYF